MGPMLAPWTLLSGMLHSIWVMDKLIILKAYKTVHDSFCTTVDGFQITPNPTDAETTIL